MEALVGDGMRSWIGAAACAAIALLGLPVRAAAPPLDSGGGGSGIQAGDDLSAAQRAAIEAQLAAAREALGLAKAPTVFTSPPTGLFAWPLRVREDYPQPGYHGTSF